MGNFREKLGRRCGQLATLALALASSAPGTPPAASGPQNFLELIGAVPPEPVDITYVTFNPNLGDDSIFHFSRLWELHRLYPKARIHFLSPLKGQPHAIEKWLDPVTIAPSAATTMTEAVEAYARTHGGPRSLFLMPDARDHSELKLCLEDRGVPESAAKAEADALAPRMERLSSELGSRGGSAVLWNSTTSGPDGLEVHYALPGTAIQHRKIPLTEIPYRVVDELPVENLTQYQRARMADRALLFGRHDLGVYPKEMVYAPGEGVADFTAWRKQHFKNPAEGHVVVSLNGGGDEKVAFLKPQYAALLDEIIQDVWRKDPTKNIIVPFPEKQFGGDVAAEVRQVVAKYPGRVGLLPPGRYDMIGAAIDLAHLTIAHDSGTAHIARGIAGPRRVLTISVNDASMDWRDVGQSFAVFIDARTPQGRNALSLKINLSLDLIKEPSSFQHLVVKGLAYCEKEEIVEALRRQLLEGK